MCDCDHCEEKRRCEYEKYKHYHHHKKCDCKKYENKCECKKCEHKKKTCKNKCNNRSEHTDCDEEYYTECENKINKYKENEKIIIISIN